MPTTTSPVLPAEQCTHQHEAEESRYWQPGHVSWFDAAKGFGFSSSDRGGPAVFCDYTAIATPGYKRLQAGQRVIFTVTDVGRGPEAGQVLTYGRPALTPRSPHPDLGGWVRSLLWARTTRSQ